MKIPSALLSLALILCFSAPSAAQTTPEGRFIDGTHARVYRLLERAPRGAAAQARQNREVGTILSALLDLEELSRRALADEWERRSAAERTEFVAILSQLVHRSYQSGLERTLRYRIDIVGETSDDDEVIVQTSAQNRENRREPPVRIDYRVRTVGELHKVVDVITDGVSMVRNYQRQFRRIIRREGWDGLMGRMRERAAEATSSD